MKEEPAFIVFIALMGSCFFVILAKLVELFPKAYQWFFQ